MLGLALVGPVDCIGARQDQGQLWHVQTISVRPDHLDEFTEGAGMVKAAAGAANLSADYTWEVWLKDCEVAIASSVPYPVRGRRPGHISGNQRRVG